MKKAKDPADGADAQNVLKGGKLLTILLPASLKQAQVRVMILLPENCRRRLLRLRTTQQGITMI